MNKKPHKLSPSDFAYLYEDCKYCYVRKVKEGIFLPSMPMPGVFSAINSRVQGNMIGKNLKDLFPGLPDAEVINQEQFVESIVIPGTNVFIKGKYDILARKSDGTHILVDLKLSQPGEDKIEKYQTQLAAYKFALENPKMGEKIPTSGLALLIFYPDKVKMEDGRVSLDFPHTWMDVPADENKFLDFIKDVDKLLEGDLPEYGVECIWCIYRKKFEPKSEEEYVNDIPF